ncbi:MAG: RNA 2',3'-cyclic phosphodiesterase [Candidatus Omnitrophica bacterium]|nr:RNA 2',3'-cyclic phosphodiesterase [Candidatus Omnitrophota bacterium]
MRTFIAIELPKQVKDALAELKNQLESSQADVKWVATQNIHLTLKFLGERDEKKIEKILQILDEVAKENQPYEINLISLGSFPNPNYPRVVWAGIDQGATQTKKIAQGLEEKIAKVGIPKEKREFSSHITIGRVKSNLNREKLIQGLDNSKSYLVGKNLRFLVTQLVLFKSTLTPKGPVYEILKTANLTKSESTKLV